MNFQLEWSFFIECQRPTPKDGIEKGKKRKKKLDSVSELKSQRSETNSKKMRMKTYQVSHIEPYWRRESVVLFLAKLMVYVFISVRDATGKLARHHTSVL